MSGSAMQKGGGSSLEQYYRSHMDSLAKENKVLRSKLEASEKKSQDLLRTVIELNTLLNTAAKRGTGQGLLIQPREVTKEEEGVARDRLAKLNGKVQSSDGISAPADNKPFTEDCRMKGHAGAVYCVKFAGGKSHLLATGSFDSTVRVWDVDKGGKETLCLRGHNLSVLDIAWAPDMSHLLSGAYDGTVKLWDLHTGSAAVTKHAEGIVQTISFDPNDPRIFFAGTTQSKIILFDTRSPDGSVSASHTPPPASALPNQGGETSTASSLQSQYSIQSMPASPSKSTSSHFQQQAFLSTSHFATLPPSHISEHGGGGGQSASITFQNNAKINSLYVTHDSLNILTGDSRGSLKFWDIRHQQCIRSINVSEEGKKRAISHVTCAVTPAGEEMKYIAVNSYDNVLRVYDRRGVVLGEEGNVTPLQTLRGHLNKNWPIKSSFFCGEEFITPEEPNAKQERDDAHMNTVEADMGDEGLRNRNKLLLCTGSSDNYAYMYDVFGTNGTGGLMQKLEGHAGRVYSSHFHSALGYCATVSSDATVRVWKPSAVQKGSLSLSLSSIAVDE
eukprot:CAMPEP_0113892392 /NCGR_PEP_ID=MMETSP0780_2-20120614/15388_1 /TAXON_ID=652834 /ORGANISM="Palpitomonas bilix" /LENGTH=558 /DNA_ID=CAMNT_0000882319 /DNA_START=379 /DNA_END=2055 /DNA_ORIENTATION=+ /assembly_acc=CAM_ASM_000599